jgi:hypothetical protein
MERTVYQSQPFHTNDRAKAKHVTMTFPLE